jgi:hypothetical protein
MQEEELFCGPCEPNKRGRGSEEAGGSKGEEQQKKKKARTKCKHPDGCEKQALKGGLCMAHGGTGAKCKHPDGCEKHAQGKGGLCTRHFKAELASQDPVGKQAQTMEAVTTLIGFRTMLS